MNEIDKVIKSMLIVLVGMMFLLIGASLYFMYVSYKLLQIGTDGGNIGAGLVLIISGLIIFGSVRIKEFVFPLLFNKEDSQ